MINRKEILVLAVVVFFTIVSWVLFEVYQLQTRALVERSVNEEIDVPKEPINTKVIDNLLNRK